MTDDPHFGAQHGYSCRSLRPVMQDETGSLHEVVFMEYNRFGKQFEQVDDLYLIRCIVTPEWKLSINLFDADELYDRISDPNEAVNRINDAVLQHIRADLHDQLLAWQKRTHDVFRRPQWGYRPWRPDYQHEFEGLNTTGYNDAWEFGHFA